MNINATIAALSEVSPPSEAERDASKMTSQQVEQAILDIAQALRHFDTLLEILQRAEFKHDDKQKAETAAALVVQRVEWGLQVLMHLKPVN
jgi:hypothetical protein